MSSYNSFLPTAARTILSPSWAPALREKSITPIVLNSYQQIRGAKVQSKGKSQTKQKRGPRYFHQKDLRNIQQFALCDAMRYIRAFEVGRDPRTTKYELHIRLKTMRDGPVIRNMLRFPHSIKTDSRICVVCPPGSRHEKEAKAAGAVLVGEDEVFNLVKAGKIEFDRCVAHPDSMDKLNKAGVARILGPKGLMPSTKTGTVVEDVASRVEMLRGGLIYREKDAVIRMPIGQLAFSPEQVRDNMRVTIDQIKKDAARLSDRINKEIHEIVLSSSHGPGFSLNGEFKSDESIASEALTGS
ncbi:hypothetical protein PHISCL_08492 [Aspergillus sclerotialis]|uniref:Uncharacterized protein n=1 Tax=Aspergillus sclerotialis TaxID=2070753 RepID=A0A3A2Z8E6_9EURO|nr:hypothetical protein PHISCL_08492 [Aspergillus sclerotialis]